MLHIPEDGLKTSCVVGIDPGSTNLGIACIEFDIETMTIVKSSCLTYNAKKIIRKESWSTEIHGERKDRIDALQAAILNYLQQTEPIQIAIESPFFNSKMPSAFGALTEVLTAIKQAVKEYDIWRVPYLIDPPTVKRAVGAAGNAGKDDMKLKVIALVDLNYKGQTPLELLDEHSIDALAVAYARFKELNK